VASDFDLYSRNKTKASSRRDMCLKQRIQRKVVTPRFLRAPQVRCAQVIGGRRTPYRNERKKKETGTSKKRLEVLAVSPRGRPLHFHHIFRLPRNPRIHPRGIRRLLVRSIRQRPSHPGQLKETSGFRKSAGFCGCIYNFQKSSAAVALLREVGKTPVAAIAYRNKL
jgi:hypothetical protein